MFSQEYKDLESYLNLINKITRGVEAARDEGFMFVCVDTEEFPDWQVRKAKIAMESLGFIANIFDEYIEIVFKFSSIPDEVR